MKLEAYQHHVSVVQHEDGEELCYFKQKTYCGAKPEPWMFQGAGHAILAISNQSYTQPCPECIKVIQTITEDYLKENSGGGQQTLPDENIQRDIVSELKIDPTGCCYGRTPIFEHAQPGPQKVILGYFDSTMYKLSDLEARLKELVTDVKTVGEGRSPTNIFKGGRYLRWRTIDQALSLGTITDCVIVAYCPGVYQVIGHVNFNTANPHVQEAIVISRSFTFAPRIFVSRLPERVERKLICFDLVPE